MAHTWLKLSILIIFLEQKHITQNGGTLHPLAFGSQKIYQNIMAAFVNYKYIYNSYYWKDLKRIVKYLDKEDIDYYISTDTSYITQGFHLFLDSWNVNYNLIINYLFHSKLIS